MSDLVKLAAGGVVALMLLGSCGSEGGKAKAAAGGAGVGAAVGGAAGFAAGAGGAGALSGIRSGVRGGVAKRVEGRVVNGPSRTFTPGTTIPMMAATDAGLVVAR